MEKCKTCVVNPETANRGIKQCIDCTTTSLKLEEHSSKIDWTKIKQLQNRQREIIKLETPEQKRAADARMTEDFERM